MSLAASITVGLSKLHILVCPSLTQPLDLLQRVLQLHCVPLHGAVLLLQRLYGLLSCLSASLLLCQLCLHLYTFMHTFL